VFINHIRPVQYDSQTMVTTIPRLETADKRELLWLLNPRRVRPDMDDAAVAGAIAQHLRRVLGLSDQVDLPQGFRRRMIEVGREFGLEQNSTAYDLTSDEEIGRELVAKVLGRVHALARERKSESFDFASSFRTMNREDRAEWLHRAALAASNADSGHPDEQRAREAEDAQTSHEETARQLLEDVARATTAAIVVTNAAAVPRAAARGAATLSGARTTKAAASTLGLAAGPIGVLAGGAFLYELRRRRKKSAKSQAQPDVRGDRRKERLSPMVQAVVTVCTFLVAHLATEEPN
jgi:hypothetical protein